MDHLHQESKVNIGPSSGEFESGLELGGLLRSGTEYDTEVSHMSAECKKAGFVMGLKFTLTNENVGAQAVETLTFLKEMLSMYPQFKACLDDGLTVDFRHEGLNVWVNVAVPEAYPDLQKLKNLLEVLDLSKENFSGRVDWKVTSGVDPTKFPTATFDDTLEKVSQFSVQGEGKFDELHHLLSALSKIAKGVSPNLKEVAMVCTASQLLTAFRSMKYEFKYDSNVVRSVLKELLVSLDKTSEEIYSTYQTMLTTQVLPMAQMMAPSFIAPYADVLKAVNLGNYELFFMVPKLRLYLRAGLNLPGLNAWLNEKFLQ